MYTDIKIANNTESDHIMVSFTNHYNAISIDRLPSKTKISWYFSNSLLCKPEFSSATKTFLFFLKKNIKKNNHSSASDWWGNIKSSFKENVRTFSKNSTTQENINILRPKEDCKTYTKKKTSNQN